MIGRGALYYSRAGFLRLFAAAVKPGEHLTGELAGPPNCVVDLPSRFESWPWWHTRGAASSGAEVAPRTPLLIWKTRYFARLQAEMALPPPEKAGTV